MGTEKNTIYVGDKPFRVYMDAAFFNLQKAGIVKIAARGTVIPKCIGIVWALLKMYAGIRLIDEHTSIVELDDNRPPLQSEPTPQSPRKRHVSVYEASLVYEPRPPNPSSPN